MTITRNTRAHPRACGENYKNLTLVELEEGSSPRVRGKRPGVGDPAPGGAHPRVCGENRSAPLDNAPSTGSSPRVRGKPIGSTGQRSLDGLIPACAGKTRCCVRGVGVPRLIPARAGKTARGAAPSRSGGAHPRACGENVPASGSPVTVPGSSPRVRGKHEDDAADPRKSRLIPARAGKTTRSPCSGCPRGAHPRACGENLSKTSPRSPPSWLIPARAGKTCTRSRA